jgi:hypothetical protein
MDNFRYFNVTIRGLAPGLLMSNGQMSDPENWYYKRAEELRGKTAAGQEVERQMVKYHITGRLYLNAAKQIVLPSEMMASALRKGGLTVTDDAPLLVDGLPAWDRLHEDERFVHRCMARGANLAPQPRYRPYFRQWSAVVPVEVDPSAVDASTMEAIFRSTGRAVGLCD